VLATVRQLEAQVHRTFTVTTIVPLTRNDPEGLAPFYVVIGWVVGGYLVASLLALARGTEPSLRWVSCGSGPGRLLRALGHPRLGARGPGDAPHPG